MKYLQALIALPLYSFGLLCLMLELFSVSPIAQLAWWGLSAVLVIALVLTPTLVSVAFFIYGGLVFIQVIGYAVLF